MANEHLGVWWAVMPPFPVCSLTASPPPFLLSLKVEYDKLASEKTEMQRHYVMVSDSPGRSLHGTRGWSRSLKGAASAVCAGGWWLGWELQEAGAVCSALVNWFSSFGNLELRAVPSWHRWGPTWHSGGSFTPAVGTQAFCR